MRLLVYTKEVKNIDDFMKYFHNKLLFNLLTKFLNIDNSTTKAGRGKFELINGVYSVPDSPTIIEFECYLLIEGDESTVVFRWIDRSNPKMTQFKTTMCYYAMYNDMLYLLSKSMNKSEINQHIQEILKLHKDEILPKLQMLNDLTDSKFITNLPSEHELYKKVMIEQNSIVLPTCTINVTRNVR